MTRPGTSFKRPPVSEVALAVYFSPPLGLRSVHTGLLWEKWSQTYPATEDHPLLPPIRPEDFGPTRHFPQIQFIGQAAGFRTWYVSQDRGRVVQLQPDRLVLNWRKLSDEDSYPRYETLRPEFERLLSDLLEFCRSEGISSGEIRLAEVTYTNPLPLEELSGPSGASRLIAPWSGKYSDSFLPSEEDLQLSLRYRIPRASSGEPAGRLYVQAQRALQSTVADGAPREVFLLQLFARGAPDGNELYHVLDFLDLAHTWVVSGFTSLTSSAMHKAWGREETV